MEVPLRINIVYCFLVLLLAFRASHAAQVVSPQTTVLGGVVFEGISAFPSPSFLPAYAESLGQPLTRDEVARLKANISRFYTGRGYLAPQVELTTHPDAAEVLVAEVIEPRINLVQLRVGEAEEAHPAQAQAEQITQQEVVSWNDIDVLVRELERSMGTKLSSSLHRMQNSEPGYFLVLEVATQVEGRLTYSAEGSERLGQHMVGAQIDVQNPFRGVANVYFSALHTLESAGYRNFGTGAAVPLSSEGLLSLDASIARAVPQDSDTASADIYQRHWLRLKWTHRLTERSDQKTSLNGRLILRDYTREESDITEVDERLRMAAVGVQTTLRGARRTSQLWADGRFGLDVLGAQREGSQVNGAIDVSFQVLEAGYTLWQTLPAGFSLRFDTAGQYSANEVPFSQRFSFGGSRFARAYEPGEFSGDTGAGAKLELRRGFTTDYMAKMRLVPYTYYGLATTYQNRNEQRDSGAAAGVGVRVLSSDFSAYVEVGKPLTVASDYRNDSARLTGRLNVFF